MTQNDCDAVFALLSEYLDGELPSTTCEELERHIQGCEPCVAFVESLRKSVKLGRSYKPEVTLAPLTDDVKQKLQLAYSKMLAERAARNS